MSEQDELLLTEKTIQFLCPAVRISNYKDIITLLKAQRDLVQAKAKQHYEQKGGNMKTVKEVREQLDVSEQELDTFSRDAVMEKITFTKSEGMLVEGYIKALKWVINEK